MTKIHELLTRGTTLSFEFGPPRTDEQRQRLEKTLLELEPLQPSFVSVTYGAGGSTRDMTREVVEHIHRDTSMTPMPHLTCVAHTRAEIRSIVEGYRDVGLVNLLALGGDPPLDATEEVASEFSYACELIDIARDIGDFSIGVAAFPEGHPRSTSLDEDRRWLASKLEAADFGITQFFFKAQPYWEMVEALSALGCDKPVIPGVIPVTNVAQVERFARLAGAEFPADLAERLYAVEGDPAEVRRIGVDMAVRLTAELLEGGAPGIHFYTLNFSKATKEIYAELNLGPGAQ